MNVTHFIVFFIVFKAFDSLLTPVFHSDGKTRWPFRRTSAKKKSRKLSVGQQMDDSQAKGGKLSNQLAYFEDKPSINHLAPKGDEATICGVHEGPGEAPVLAVNSRAK
jgi:hypothetical protein